MQLVLSLFSGVGLLDKAFQDNGFVVVSAGDLITGQDIRNFKGIKNKFDGIIGGSPCQDFSKANRDRPVLKNSYGQLMINEFIRVVKECEPTWFLLENVPLVSDVEIDSYNYQRIDINQKWFENVNRLRHIQFGHKEGKTLQIERNVTLQHDNIQSCALASDRRTFRQLCKLQGLPDTYDLPSFNVAGKKRAIGNGVPLSMGNAIAKSVKDVTDLEQNNVTDRGQLNLFDSFVTDQDKKICLCGCGRFVTSQRAKYYDYSCRKRAQRKREKSE